MNWIKIENSLPEAIPDWYLHRHDTSGSDSVLVFGYDIHNFWPRYEVVFINDLASLKPREDGKYVLETLWIYYWCEILYPLSNIKI